MNKWFLILVVGFPFANLLHVLYPAWIFGKSAWVVLPVLVVFLAYCYMLVSGKDKVSLFDVTVLFLVICSSKIFLIRWYLYRESINVLDIRYVWTSLIFLGFTSKIGKVPRLMDTIGFGVLAQGILTSIARIINFYIFPNVMVSRSEIDEVYINTEGQLTRDLLMGSSISGNHIICGMITLLVLFDQRRVVLSYPAFITTQFILLLGVLNTLSRYPIFVAVIFFLLSVFNVRRAKIKDLFIILVLLVGLVFFNIKIGFLDIDFYSRFAEDSGGRDDKLKVAFILLSNSAVDFLIGSPNEMISRTTVNGVNISDNSYGLLAITLGVPFMCCYFVAILKNLYKATAGLISKIAFIYILIGLGLTNCILWEPWVFTAFLCMAVVKHYSDETASRRLLRNC
jgi:hypothetical protein